MSLVEVAMAAAQDAARILVDGLGSQAIFHKGRIDLVTEVDLASENAIRRVLERETPHIPIFAEEGGGARDAQTRWIVDPLDGTTNYVHGFPMYGVSIGLQVDGEMLVGVIADPIRKRMYRAEKSKGAFCNDERLRVSQCDALVDALAGTGFPYDRHHNADRYLAYVSAVMRRCRGSAERVLRV
jgi:myo-inositol-1(or 4)-monophosphatase